MVNIKTEIYNLIRSEIDNLMKLQKDISSEVGLSATSTFRKRINVRIR